MRKFLFAVLAAMAVGTAAFSQVREKGTELNFSIGYNGSDASAPHSDFLSGNYDVRIGFNAGISADNYFSNRWSLKVGAYYYQKGWNNGIYATSEELNTTDYHLNYLTVPVLANWHFGRKRKWYLNFGPYAGFLLSAKETFGGNDVKGFFNTVDAGLDAGIGFKFRISDKARFFVEYNEQDGIAGIAKGSGTPTVRNQSAGLSVGLNF